LGFGETAGFERSADLFRLGFRDAQQARELGLGGLHVLSRGSRLSGYGLVRFTCHVLIPPYIDASFLHGTDSTKNNGSVM
jgi:hypothetical protein